jgi:hypothetical protein
VPKIEYVTVADHAEAVNGKLYLHGAGWSDIPQLIGPDGNGALVHIGIATSILVGWGETNRRFPLQIRVLHEDGAELLKIAAQIEAGRPPGTPHGSDMRSMLAVNAQVQFPKPGSYEVRAELDTDHEQQEVRSVVFRVHGVAAAQSPA